MAKLLIFLLTLSALSYAQEPITLTEQEQAQWAAFDQQDKALLAQLRDTAPQARQLSASNTEQAVRYLSAMKEIYSAIDLNSTQRALWLAKLQTSKHCEACTISEDGKTLIRPDKK